MLPIKLVIDEDFYKDEVRNDFFVDREKKRVWAVLLDLLNEFSQVCSDNGIEWFADAGTILGAARHGGFIPWDDDIDVMMTRSNYEKICAIGPKAFKHPYFFQTELTDPGSLRFHAQLRNSDTTGILYSEKQRRYSFNQGIFIDIFPIDNLPDNLGERKAFLKKLGRIRRRSFFVASATTRFDKANNAGLKGVIRSLIHFFYGRSERREIRLFRRFNKLSMKYCDRTTKNASKLFQLPLSERRIWRNDWLQDKCYLQFEMLRIPVPQCYEIILEKFYGDWWVCKKSASTHGDVFFDVDNSFEKYIAKNVN